MSVVRASQFLLGLWIGTILALPLSAQSIDSPPATWSQEEFEDSVPLVDLIQSLTYQEVDQILLEVQEFEVKNKDATTEEIEQLVENLVRQQMEKPVKRFRKENSTLLGPLTEEGKDDDDYLPESVAGLNPLEQRLCARSSYNCL